MSKEEIEFVVKRLFEQNYFEYIQPIDDENIYSHFEIKLQKTNVNIEFIISGESFDPKLVSTIFGLDEEGHYLKGDKLSTRASELSRGETCWFYSIGYSETYDVNLQMEKILDIFESKENTLIKMKEELNLNYKLVVSIRIENGEIPSIYFCQRVISFSSMIQADMDIDIN